MAFLTRLPLRRRIMAFVTAGVGLTVLVVAVAGLEVIAQSTARILEERAVTAQIAAATLNERLSASQQRLEALASTFRLDSTGTLTPDALRTLALSQARPGLFTAGFIVTDPRGRVAWPPQLLGTLVEEPAVSGAIAGSPSISGLVRLPFGKKPLAAMWVPVRASSGETIGALGGLIDLRSDALVELIRPLASGRTGHAVIVDSDGMVLAGTEAHELFTRGDHPDFFGRLIREQRVHVGHTPEIEDGVEQEDHVMAFAPLQIGSWGLGFGQAEWEVFLHERALGRRFFLLGLMLVGIGLFVAWWDAGVIATPLRRLTVSAGRIAEGDLQSPIRAERGHEVGMLADALETMRSNLAHARAELESRTATMARQAEQTRALYSVSRSVLSEAHLGDVLSTVASSAQSLLGTQVSAICLWDGDRCRVIPGAFYGPPQAFHSTAAEAACEKIALQGDGSPATTCPFVRPEFRQAHLTTQVRAGERLIGFICVATQEARRFDEADRQLLGGLASLAALAIESTQLRERVQQLAVLEERERIGRDLHDSTIQSLYGISLTLEHAQHLLASRPAQAAARLDQVMESVTQAIKDIRSYVMGLHEAHEDDTLPQALDRVAREFRVSSLLPVEVRTRGEVADLGLDARLHLELLVREALANVARHAGPARAEVTVSAEDGAVRIVVTDDGRGFEPQAARSAGLGLRTMAERARRLGGSLVVRSAPGEGTTVEVTLPVGQERSVPS